MKICTICDDHFPSYWTATNQVITTASNLGKIGVEVDLMIPVMGKNIFKSRERRLRQLCEFYGVEPTFNLKDFFTVWPTNQLRVEKLTHGLVSPFYAALGKYDLVYTRHVIPVLITLAVGGRAIFETYRLLPEEYPSTIPLLRWASSQPGFLGITTHSELSRNVFIEAGVPPEKVKALHNGYDPEEFKPEMTRAEARRLLGLDEDKYLVVYTGHMTAIKGIEILVDIAEQVPEVDFLLVGGPTEEDVKRVRDIAASKGLKNVNIQGWVNPHKVPPYLYAADILVIPPTSKPLRIHRRTVLPIKLFNYLAAGRVILSPELPDTSELLQHGVNSWRIEPDDPAIAAEAIRMIKEDPILAGELAQRAKEDSRKYTWYQRAINLRNYMEERLETLP
ncbi:glycosyltransferase [Myxococcota bacterium]|nr:glycosyltransferase [Myxococcota bacterium]MBU1496062.1 glycosyltransferase [Myxococcota bacterium]